VPYYACPRCRLTYYSAASWAYVPECPRCYQPLDRPSHVRDRVVSIARRTKREGREPSDGSPREGGSESGICIPLHRPAPNRADWITSAQEAEVAAAASDSAFDVERNGTTVLAYRAEHELVLHEEQIDAEGVEKKGGEKRRR
jgi:hypothetical protein